MKQAKLIKRQEVTHQVEESPTSENQSVTKHPVETVREWISHRQNHQVSARQAFAALFAGPRAEGTI